MGRRFAVLLLVLLAPPIPTRAESQVEIAIQALRKDSSLKVRTQAAIILGQRTIAEAVSALREAVATDQAAAVRLAAVGALGKIRDRSARPTLRAAADADSDAAVRKAAQKALEDLGPLSFSIDEPGGTGSAAARGALRDALTNELRERGFAVVDRGGMRLKAAVLEGGARLSASGAIPEAKLGIYSAKALEATAKTLCEDLAAKLGER